LRLELSQISVNFDLKEATSQQIGSKCQFAPRAYNVPLLINRFKTMLDRARTATA
jgi:hypothetical protein